MVTRGKMENSIQKPDIFKDAIKASALLLEHAKSCKRCISVFCSEGKVLENKSKELSDKARSTEDQVIIKVIEKNIIPEGYFEVLMGFKECLDKSNENLSSNNFMGWEGLDDSYILENEQGEKYCKWDIAKALLSKSFLVPESELEEILKTVNDTNKNYFGLKKYIEAENVYREHINICQAKNQECAECSQLFHNAEFIRTTVLNSIGNDVIWNRYLSLEGYLKGKVSESEISPSLDLVIETLKKDNSNQIISQHLQKKEIEELSKLNPVQETFGSNTSEIEKFLDNYADLLKENETLREELESLKENKVLNSNLTDEETKKEFEKLITSNRELRERVNNLLESCKAFSRFSITSTELMIAYANVGISEAAIKYNEQYQEVSKHLMDHMTK